MMKVKKQLDAGVFRQLDGSLKQAEALIDKIATLREKLRERWGDIEDVLSSLDDADDELRRGMDSVRDGIDTMSQYL